MQADAAEPTAPQQPLPPPAAQDSAGADETAPETTAAEPEPGLEPINVANANASVDAEPDAGPEGAATPSPSPAPVRVNPVTGRGERPAGMTTGIGCTALLLPVFAVASALACFAAGVWSTSTGCTPDGSALCSSAGPWFTFALPLFVAPLVAAVTATGAVVAKRHRSTWLAVGYAVVFISLVVGLVSANTGAS
jgi:hypothetical protein